MGWLLIRWVGWLVYKWLVGIGGCLDDLKTRETFSLAKIDWWFHGHPALHVQQAVDQQVQKFPTLHREWILGFQELCARSTPLATSHLMHGDINIFPLTLHLPTTIFHWTVNKDPCTTFPSTDFLWPTNHMRISDNSRANYMSCQSLPFQFCNLDIIYLKVHFIMQCSALSTVIKQCMSFTVSVHFKLQKSYLHLLLPGHWWSKYSFPWEKVHNHRQELSVLMLLFSSVGFPYRKTQNTIKYTEIDIHKNSVFRGGTAMLEYSNDTF